jgi:hypothetical protein
MSPYAPRFVQATEWPTPLGQLDLPRSACLPDSLDVFSPLDVALSLSDH